MNESRTKPLLAARPRWLALSALLIAGCAADPTGADDALELTTTTALALDAQTAGDVDAAMSHPGRHDIDWDRVHTVDHFVRVGPHREVFVRESFTLRSWLRGQRRAILMAGPPPVTEAFLNIPIDGYRLRERLAAEGFFAFTMDLEGAGQSTHPADGFDVTYASQTEVMLRVVDQIRLARGVRRVDLYGEGEAAGVAAQACANRHKARSCTLASVLYATGTDFFDATFNSPEFRALVLNAPQGYLPIGPDAYFNVLSASSPEVIDWVRTTQPGTYTMGLIAEYFRNTPPFDVTRAAVPALVIRGELDQNAPLADTLHLANDYGAATGAGPASVVEIAGARLIPRIEPAPRNEAHWNALIQFLDP